MSQPKLSPDGKWLWNGTDWVPAPSQTEPEAVSQAAPIIDAVSQEYSVPQQQLAQTSAHFDLNQDGELSYGEVQQAAQSISNPAPHFSPPSSSKSSNKMIIISTVIVVLLLILGSSGFVLLSPDYSPFDTIRDTDSDGVVDADDVFPEDSSETKDSDNDGVGDNLDAFPEESTQSLDVDGDGYGDNPNGSTPDAFPDDSSEWNDSDSDGTGDNSDDFPLDQTQWLDSDGDGHGDNQNGNSPDAFRLDPTQWQDGDGDGYGDNPGGDNSDAFPDDSSEWKDSDSDGTGDNSDDCPNAFGTSTMGSVACPDADSDGWSDSFDAFSTDSTEWFDDDDDGIGNNADLLDDGDAWIGFDVVTLQADASQEYDIFGNAPDMFIKVWHDADCDAEVDSEELLYSSSYKLDSYSVSSSDGMSVGFDIPDDSSLFCFGILVYDSDDSDDDLLDYVTGQGSWYKISRTLSDDYSSTIEHSNNHSGEYKSVNIEIDVYVW